MRRVHLFGGGIIGKEITIYKAPDVNLLVTVLDPNSFVKGEDMGYLKAPKFKMLTMNDYSRSILEGYFINNTSDLAKYTMKYGFQLNAISYLNLVGSMNMGVRCTGFFRYKQNQLSEKESEMVYKYNSITEQLLELALFKGSDCVYQDRSDFFTGLFYLEGFGKKPSVSNPFKEGVITLSPKDAVFEKALE